MTPYERYIFDDKCPYTNEFCYKDIACVNCEMNTHEIEDAEELDRAESEDLGDYPDAIPNQYDNLTGSMNL